MTSRLSLALGALLVSLAAGTFVGAPTAHAQSGGPCDRACLRDFADRYIEALSRRDPTSLALSDTVKYTENGRVIGLGDGFWHTAGQPLAYRDYVLDPESGGVAVLTALEEYGAVAQMFLRLKIRDREIAEIETFVVRVGDQRWFAPEQLAHFSDIFAQTVPAAERHSRQELVDAANAYFTAVQTEGTPAFEQAPFGDGMNRYENGLRTTNVETDPINDRHTLSAREQLERAYYKGTHVTDRRFPVVDIEHGSVLGIVTFRRDGPDTPTLLLAEIFKVTDGRLREIRAVMLNVPNGAGTGWSAASR
jgi:hypothetical protein